MNRQTASGNILSQDLDHILKHTEAVWDSVRRKRVFITGGTGFFGKWLLESFLWANERLNLGAEVHVLSRNPAAFTARHPLIAKAPGIRLHLGDVRTFSFPLEQCDFVIHAATDADVQLQLQSPLLMVETIVQGTRRALEFARHSGTKRFLLISSGAVYGKQPPDLSYVAEDFGGAPDPAHPASAYGESKRLAELLCSIYQKEYGMETTVARCFAFVGPYLNLDRNYAVGNFIRDALKGGPITISGDGTPYRSYLYAADLAIWLWTLLIRGTPGERYNVGSSDEISIHELAHKVRAAFTPSPDIVVTRTPIPGAPRDRYVPSVKKITDGLGVDAHIMLDEALRRTIRWHQTFSSIHDN